MAKHTLKILWCNLTMLTPQDFSIMFDDFTDERVKLLSLLVAC